MLSAQHLGSLDKPKSYQRPAVHQRPLETAHAAVWCNACWVASVTGLLPGRHSSVASWLRWQRHQTIPRCGILLSQISDYASNVEAEGGGVSPSDGADVLDDFIGKVLVSAINRLDHGQSSNNSSGVQITGASKPDDVQTSAMRFRIVAFAMCRQFQVRR